MPKLWTRLKTLMRGGASKAAVADLEQVLLEADFGPQATFELVDRFEARRKRADFRSDEALRDAIIEDISALLTPPSPLSPIHSKDRALTIVLVVGVNGTGKTTTVAKLAHRVKADGLRVHLAAADTFRAAAVEQLEIWAKRLGVPCVTGAPGGDPAAVAFDAVDAAEKQGSEVVLIDTAGRLHTQSNLMEELKKVTRVLGKRTADAPHHSLLVLDGTTGQNMLNQARVFADAVRVTGLVVTKLDGTAKGGAVVALAKELCLYPHFLGTGESVSDLTVFDPQAFAETLLSV